MSGKKKRLLPRLMLGGTLVTLILIGFSLGILLAKVAGEKNIPQVPTRIAEKALFPIYLPQPLPKDYRILDQSYHIEEGALLFQATNASKKISFAQQAKPKEFDFDAFYKQLGDTKNLQDAPFTSVLGKTKEGTRVLSVLTDKTWLLITTTNASEADLRFIAKHLKQQ